MWLGQAPEMRWPSIRTLRFADWKPRTTTSFAMPPFRSFQTPGVAASASPTSRAGLSRISAASTLSRGESPTTVMDSRTVETASASVTSFDSPSASRSGGSAAGVKPAASALRT